MLPDPMSCLSHLNESERAEHEEHMLQSELEFGLMFEIAWYRLINSDPACWSWPAPTDDDLARVRDSYSQETQEVIGENGWRPILMTEWQQGRCAICGRHAQLVNDHDHETGLRRGGLCRSCNALEGLRYGGVFAKYRERNPASICGVRERYWNPVTHEFAEPAPPPRDPWLYDPLEGLL